MAADDLAAVTNVINLCAVASDSHCYELFEQVFTADACCDLGGDAAGTDLAALITAFRDIHASFSATQHIVSDRAVRADGNDAWCLSHVDPDFQLLSLAGESEAARARFFDMPAARCLDLSEHCNS